MILFNYQGDEREWISRIWDHQYEWSQDPIRKTYVSKWACLRATIALLLGRFDPAIEDWKVASVEVAWGNDGTYYCDFGTGQSWDACIVHGFRYSIISDGSL